MASLRISTKRLQIDKANTTIVAVVGVSSFIIVSSLIFCKALLAQRSYQSKVIKAQSVAKDQLKEDIESVGSLKVQYQAFADQAQNIIGGSATGSGDHDGDNARIVLDALPSKYDFPALASSLDKLFANSGAKVANISGVDDEIAQSSNTTDQPVELPFTLGANGTYDSIKNFISLFERSIRPLDPKSAVFSGKESELGVTVIGSTYYRPAKTLNIKQQDVKP